jgi:orotate phosphoribosyltransferase
VALHLERLAGGPDQPEVQVLDVRVVLGADGERPSGNSASAATSPVPWKRPNLSASPQVPGSVGPSLNAPLKALNESPKSPTVAEPIGYRGSEGIHTMVVQMRADLDRARETLLAELREHALVIGEVTLSSGQTAQYYVDAKRALLRPAAYRAAGELIVAEAAERGATAVGGMTMGADPLACAAIGAEGGDGLVAFFVRKERKEHGLQRWIEGPVLEPGTRCLVVEDVVTTGGSTVRAIERIGEEGLEVAGVTSVVDRLADGAEAIADASGGAPYRPLLTIDDLYPDRPDR